MPRDIEISGLSVAMLDAIRIEGLGKSSYTTPNIPLLDIFQLKKEDFRYEWLNT